MITRLAIEASRWLFVEGFITVLTAAHTGAAGLDELVELVRRMETDESGKKLWAYGTILAYCYDRIAGLRQAQAGEYVLDSAADEKEKL